MINIQKTTVAFFTIMLFVNLSFSDRGTSIAIEKTI